jgi:hypothetical protein
LLVRQLASAATSRSSARYAPSNAAIAAVSDAAGCR